MAADYDVLIAADLRGTGGRTDSIAQEIEVQARMGLRTGVMHIGSPEPAGRVWATAIRALVHAGIAELVGPRVGARTELLVVRGSDAVLQGPGMDVEASQVVFVADEWLDDSKGVARLAAKLTAELGEVTWAPSCESVRAWLAGNQNIELSERNWVDVLDCERFRPMSLRKARATVIIGRHSHDDYAWWPNQADELVTVYPEDRSVLVRVMGGGIAAREVMGRHLKFWRVFRRTAVETREFLETLDVYVHVHDSKRRHVCHRELLEALAVGLPAVTHSYLEPDFGASCRYGKASEVPALVQELAGAGPGSNQAGIELVRDNHDWDQHRRRLQDLLERDLPELTRPKKGRKRVIFMSSNGSGMGHLTRLLAIARHLPEDHEALFLTLSTGLRAVESFDFWCDYIPSARAAALDNAYHGLLRARVGAALRSLRPDALVFDGTFPYKGLRQALADYPGVRGIWCRRAMWKQTDPEVTERSLQHAEVFDMVIEPGDFADDADKGATRAVRHLAETVEPIVLLANDEILTRDEARRELEIADDEVAVLLNLGAGNINRIDGLGEVIGETLGRAPNVHLFVLRSLIAKQAFKVEGAKVSPLEMYPLSRVLRAFDGCIAAPGYNSFHELLAYSVPSILIPNEDTALDDQVARARWASEAGMALMGRENDVAGLAEALEQLLDGATRDELRSRCETLGGRDGGRQAAARIAGSVRSHETFEPGPPPGPPTIGKRLYRVGRSVYRFGVRLGTLARPRGGAPKQSRATVLVKRVQRRSLVIAGDASADQLDDIIDWAGRQPNEVVVAAPGEHLTRLRRLGLRAERLTPSPPDDSVDTRIQHGLYDVLKLDATLAAFRCSNVVHWVGAEDADLSLAAVRQSSEPS